MTFVNSSGSCRCGMIRFGSCRRIHVIERFNYSKEGQRISMIALSPKFI